MQLSLYKITAKFPNPGGFKGILYDQGLKEIQTAIVNLPELDIEELARDLILIWSAGPSDTPRKT